MANKEKIYNKKKHKEEDVYTAKFRIEQQVRKIGCSLLAKVLVATFMVKRSKGINFKKN